MQAKQLQSLSLTWGCSFQVLFALQAAIERMLEHMQEERSTAEEAAHVATEEAIRKAEAHAAKQEEAGNALNLST